MWPSKEPCDYIFLMGKEKVNLRDLCVATVVEEVYEEAVLDIGVDIHNTGDREIDMVMVRALVQDPDGVMLTTGSSRLIGHVTHLKTGARCHTHLSMRIKRPMLGSTDAPRQYSILLILEDNHGRILDAMVREFYIQKPDWFCIASTVNS